MWWVKESWTVHPQDVCCSRRAQMCPAKFYNIKLCENEIGKPVTRYKYLPVCRMDSHDVLSYWNVYELHTVSAAQKMITDMLFQHNMPGNLYKLKVMRDNPPLSIIYNIGKGLPQQAEVAQGVPGRLRPPILLTFSTMRVVGRQPYTPAAFTPGEISGTHF